MQVGELSVADWNTKADLAISLGREANTSGFSQGFSCPDLLDTPAR